MGTVQTVTTALLLLVLIFHGAEGCGWTTTNLTGTVQSPNFPSNYSNNLNCVYIITAPVGYRITLTFTYFDTATQDECSDYLLIRNGREETSPFLDQHCGRPSVLYPARTFGNQMWIQFFSDSSNTGGGFSATFVSAYLQAPYFFITSSKPQQDVGGFIYRTDVETISSYRIPFEEILYHPKAVDFDPVEQIIYWTEVGEQKDIRRSAIDGTGIHTVLRDDASNMEGMAVDPASRLIFYTDAGRDLIAMVTMSTFAHKTIISTDLDKPRAIVLHTADGVMFWTDWGANRKIERANYDGTERRTLIDSGLYRITALALDVHNSRLYWIDSGTNRVEMSDLDGGGRDPKLVMAISNTFNFFGLAYLNGSLYFTDWQEVATTVQGRLVKLDLSTSIATVIGSATDELLHDIHVVDPQLSATYSVNGCGDDNGGCSVICIPLPSNSSKCACPDNQTLASDQTSCEGGTSTTTMATVTTSPGPSAFPVVVSTSDPQPFDTNGDVEMTLTCAPDLAVAVSSYAWSGPCAGQTGRTCVFTPRPAEDDGKRVTCTVTSSDGRVASGALKIELDYPPQDSPTIHGYSQDKVYQVGDRLTITCSVHGGKPLVKAVLFSCGIHVDNPEDIVGSTEVHSGLTVDPLSEDDNGVICVCIATWKVADWYKLSATQVLNVAGTAPPKPQEVNIIAIAVGCAAAVVVIVAIIIIACLVIKRRRPPYERRITKRQKIDENPYSGLELHPERPQLPPQRPGIAVPPVQPYMINEAFQMDLPPCVSPEDDNDPYDTLTEDNDDNYLSPVEGAVTSDLKPLPCSRDKQPSPDNSYIHAEGVEDNYLSPVEGAVTSDLKPVPCSRDKQPSPDNSYIHAVTDPNDYVRFKVSKPN